MSYFMAIFVSVLVVVFPLDVASPAEAIKALIATVDGFKEQFLEYSSPGYYIFVGRENKNEEGLWGPADDVIKIVPVMAGAKDAFGQILTGIAIIAVVYFTGGTGATFMQAAAGNWLSAIAINVGTAMVIGGVAQLLMNAPQAQIVSGGDKGPTDNPTYSFSAPHMTVGQGNPVPVLLGGPLRIGGALIGMGISSQNWQKNGLGGLAPDEIGLNHSGNGDTAPYIWAIAPTT